MQRCIVHEEACRVCCVEITGCGVKNPASANEQADILQLNLQEIDVDQNGVAQQVHVFLLCFLNGEMASSHHISPEIERHAAANRKGRVIGEIMQGVCVIRKQHGPVHSRDALRTIGGGIGQNTEVVGRDCVIIRKAQEAESIRAGCNPRPLPLIRRRILRRWVGDRGDRNMQRCIVHEEACRVCCVDVVGCGVKNTTGSDKQADILQLNLQEIDVDQNGISQQIHVLLGSFLDFKATGCEDVVFDSQSDRGRCFCQFAATSVERERN